MSEREWDASHYRRTTTLGDGAFTVSTIAGGAMRSHPETIIFDNRTHAPRYYKAHRTYEVGEIDAHHERIVAAFAAGEIELAPALRGGWWLETGVEEGV